MRQSQIARIIAAWQQRNPSFLWAPAGRRNLLRDQASEAVGRLVGPVQVINGGLAKVTANSSDSWIEFQTNAGLISGNTPFIGVAIVSVTDPAAVTGAIFKVGDAASGWGIGAGSTTFEDVGDKMIAIQENVAWRPGSGTWVPGLNILTFGYTTENVFAYKNVTAGTSADFNMSDGIAPTGAIAPSQKIQINGYLANRGSNIQVHAVALFPVSVTNSQYNEETERITRPVIGYGRLPRRGVLQLFRPQPTKTWQPFKTAAGTVQAAELTEAASTSDALASLMARLGAVAESAGAADTQSAIAALLAATSESLTTADLQAAAASASSSAVEAASAADSLAALAAIAAQVTDAVAASEAVARAVLAAVEMAEAAAMLDVVAAAAAASAALSEAAAPADSASANQALDAASVAEAVAPSESVALAATQAVAALAEAASVADAAGAALVTAAGAADVLSLADLYTAGLITLVAVTAAAAAADTLSSEPVTTSALAESATAADSLAAAAGLIAQVAEQTTIVDQLLAAASLGALLVAPAAAADTAAATAQTLHTASIAEQVAAIEALLAYLASEVFASAFWRFDVPAESLRFDVPGTAGAWRYDVPSVASAP